MLISSGLVKNVDFEERSDDEEFGLPRGGRRATSVESLLENSPPKKLLSIPDLGHGGEKQQSEDEKNKETEQTKTVSGRQGKGGDSAAQANPPDTKQCSAYFAKEKIESKPSEDRKSSLASLLEKKATRLWRMC